MSEPNQNEAAATEANASAPQAVAPAEMPFLERAPLAYENPAFLNSPDGRVIRILSEYTEPLARFRREHIQDTVVFFGSARFCGKEEADRALELLKMHDYAAIFCDDTIYEIPNAGKHFLQGLSAQRIGSLSGDFEGVRHFEEGLRFGEF